MSEVQEKERSHYEIFTVPQAVKWSQLARGYLTRNRGSHGLPRGVGSLVFGGYVFANKVDADIIRAWAESLPGYSNPHFKALLFK